MQPVSSIRPLLETHPLHPTSGESQEPKPRILSQRLNIDRLNRQIQEQYPVRLEQPQTAWLALLPTFDLRLSEHDQQASQYKSTINIDLADSAAFDVSPLAHSKILARLLLLAHFLAHHTRSFTQGQLKEAFQAKKIEIKKLSTHLQLLSYDNLIRRKTTRHGGRYGLNIPQSFPNIAKGLDQVIKERIEVLKRRYADLQAACECQCPVTRPLIPILWQYIALVLDLDPLEVREGVQLWAALDSRESCLIGSPIGVAAGFAYVITQRLPKKEITQQIIADICGLSPTTIYNNAIHVKRALEGL
jgi:hypothetical protein